MWLSPICFQLQVYGDTWSNELSIDYPTAVIKFQYVASRIKSAQLFFGILCNHFHWTSLSLTKYSLTSQFAKQTVFHGLCLVISLDLPLDFHCLFYPSVPESGCVSASPISIWISSIRNSLLRTVVHEIARHDGILNDSLIFCLEFIWALRSNERIRP